MDRRYDYGAPAADARAELAVIYGALAAVVHEAAGWVDLGGVDELPEGADLPRRARASEADLQDADGIARVRSALGPFDPAGAVVSCLHVVDRCPDPAPLLELLFDLAGQGATVVLSVADPAPGSWGQNPAEELRRLAPGPVHALRVIALRGAALVADSDVEVPLAPVKVSTTATAAAHVIAFGPRADRLGAGAVVEPADLAGERAERNALSADLALYKARAATTGA